MPIDLTAYRSAYEAGGIWGQNPEPADLGNQSDVPEEQPGESVPQESRPMGPEVKASPKEIADEVHRLVKAAADKTRQVMTGDEAKAVGKSIGLDRNSTFKAVVKDFKTCAAAMAKLSTVRIDALFVTDGHGALKLDKNGQLKLDKSIQSAIDASFAASEKLGDLINALGGRKSDEMTEQQAEILARNRAALEDLKLRCDARASELLTLSMQVADLDGLQRAALARTTVKDRFDAMDTAVMHENPQFAASDEMIRLGDELATLRRDTAREESGFHGDAARLDRRAEVVQDRLAEAGNVGEAMRREIAAELDLSRERLAARKQTATAQIRRSFVKTFLPKPVQLPDFFAAEHPFGQKIRENSVGKAFCDYVDDVNAFFAHLKAYFEGGPNAPDRDALDGELEELENGFEPFLDDCGSLCRYDTGGVEGELVDILLANKNLDETETMLQINDLAERFRNGKFLVDSGLVVNEYRRIFDRTVDFRENHLADVGVARKDIANLFSGATDVCTLTEARVHGATEEMLEKECSDDLLISAEPLGSGAANEVVRLTFRKPDGTEDTRIFKPEAPSEVGLHRLVLGQNDAYTNVQQTAMLNFASSRTAEFLGTPRAVVRTTVGVHDGQYGIFMEEASGTEAAEMLLPPPEFRGIRTGGYHSTDPDQRKLISSLNKGLTDLRWNDILTGQGDRHAHNYLIGFKDGKARVTGIDNDMSFPAYRTGLFRFRLKKIWAERFVGQVREIVQLTNGLTKKDPEVNRLLQECLKDKVTTLPDEELEVDLGNPPDRTFATALGIVTGNKSFNLPPYMSRTMHDNLVDGNRRRELLESWRTALDPAAFKAAEKRLEEMAELAVEYANQGKILENEEDWGSSEVTKNLMKVKPEIEAKPTTSDRLREVHKKIWDHETWFCSGFLGRDFEKCIGKVVE